MKLPSLTHVAHIALQGCLKSGGIDYGVSADTGGHIRYVLELADALETRGLHQTIVTRQFHDARLGACYSRVNEKLSEATSIHRLTGVIPHYLPKEELYTDREALMKSLFNWFASLDTPPQLIHAHYSDAGVLAASLKAEFGVPFIFTPHSLGVVKLESLRCTSRIRPDLVRRVADEQMAISAADSIVVSSKDEAIKQLGFYEVDAGRVLINSPGCALTQFQRTHGANEIAEARQLMDPWLDEPERPAILALARPVWRKNLHGLLQCFAMSQALQARANLVIVAGCHDDHAELDEEGRSVIACLRALITEHGLDGKVALPERHTMNQVPGLFACVRDRGGIFANIAFNEPFGLTILEAAAVGLPVIATSSGGCGESVNRCGHGVVVEPDNLVCVASTAERLLSDPARWLSYSQAGRRSASYYHWDRHARQYLADISGFVQPDGRPAISACRKRSRSQKRQYLISDMDGTLLGGRNEQLVSLNHWLYQHPDTGFIVSSGRQASTVVEMLESAACRMPDAIIGALGSQIHKVRNWKLLDPDTEWVDTNAQRWDRERCELALAELGNELSLQPHSEQNAIKLSYIKHSDRAIVPLIRAQLEKWSLSARIVLSHRSLIDIVPAGMGKASAGIRYCQLHGVTADALIAAGDSGNDADMLRRFGRAIVVSNHTGELEHLRSVQTVYFAKRSEAGGVLEGMRHWHESGPETVAVPYDRHATPVLADYG